MASMCIEIYPLHWLPNQQPPAEYRVFGVWGKDHSGDLGTSYYWGRGKWPNDENSKPFDTKWEARRDAIAHLERMRDK